MHEYLRYSLKSLVFLLTNMSPVASFMDSRSECSGASISGEDCASPSESERGEGVHVERSGKKRAKNRDSARKSRKKQTERADILHQELQTLERSNSALEKEIAFLRKEFQHYTVTLEKHQSLCCLRLSPIPRIAPVCPVLPVSKSTAAPVTIPGPSMSLQTTPGSPITPVTGEQRPASPAPSLTLLPLSRVYAVTNLPSPTNVTNPNPYPLLSTLSTPECNITPSTTLVSLLPTQTTSNQFAPTTTHRSILAPSTMSSHSYPLTSYPVSQYPLTLLPPASEPSVELSLSDLLDSPDWLCNPASTTWGDF